MFGEKALDLIKELNRCKDTLPPFNDVCLRQVLEEMKSLFDENQKDVNVSLEGRKEYFSSVYLRHAALERNKRCLLAYLHNRLERIRQMRWEFGSILPPEIKSNMCEPEIHWFNQYSKTLATYMRSIGDGTGLDLTQDTKPPKSLYVEVRCLTDFGEFETEDGDIVLLRKNSQHFLPRSQCENLIRRGVLEHVVN